MRVKLLLALAIASIVLICSASVAFAADSACVPCSTGSGTTDTIGTSNSAAIPTSVSGVPTAEQLSAAANNEIAAFGFPDLSAVDTAVGIPADTIEATTLTSPLCGVCGQCPPCSCEEKTTVIPGPQVNLGCPLLTVCPVPVNLVSPVITPVFPAINVAPQALVNVPQVNAKLNCFDIECQPVTNINQCLPCPTQKPKDP